MFTPMVLSFIAVLCNYNVCSLSHSSGQSMMVSLRVVSSVTSGQQPDFSTVVVSIVCREITERSV